MWGAALLLLGGALVGLGGAAGEDDSPYNEYYDRDPALNYEEEEEGDFYAIYDETDTIATLLTDPVTVTVSRKRRYEEPANAIEPQRMQYIQDVLKQVMAGRDIEDELDGLADNEDGFPFRPSRTSEMRPAVRYSPTATKIIINTTSVDDVETVTEPSNTYTTVSIM
ncbi:uncharacterized protein LOC135118973 [Helicoverpa armigera]|uniref:uncharacterized protein LOC135118973 n=1 Tax=Helicoverpa armigera TaxID=29058 RepID=UPI0030827D33